MCTQDIEILTISVRPFYLPREFGQIMVSVVYVPPQANTSKASNYIRNVYDKFQSLSPGCPHFILGDFNKCTLNDVLPDLYQYVNCSTRFNSTIDLCYGNIKNAFKSYVKPPLGTSDHNVVHLMPCYKQKLKTEKPVVKNMKSWTKDSLDTLKGCFDSTDWDMFSQSCDTLDELTTVITDYITYCVDSIIPTRTIKVYLNNKPWITKEFKSVLNDKKRAFCAGNIQEVKDVQKDIVIQTAKCRQNYKEKIEQQFAGNNLRLAWGGLKSIIGAKNNMQTINVPDNMSFATELNTFYARFDCHDFNREIDEICSALPLCDDITITESDVLLSFTHLNARKSAGPDNISGFLLKECGEQLASVFQKIFQKSVSLCKIPSLWKTSNIIPIPKIKKPSVQNDYRPVALTSIPMKCLERIIKNVLLDSVEHLLDPLQFAYRRGRGTDDATLTLLHKVYSHLDKGNSYVRLLFADFSSAFNTIQPHLLLSKLCNMGVGSTIIKWIKDFMVCRNQFVSVNGSVSPTISVSTGAPQGCVLSPILFTIYTNECFSTSEDVFTIKFADDAVLSGLLSTSELSYRQEIANFTEWCQKNFLVLNTKKTKEIIIDFRKKKTTFMPIVINGEEIEIVNKYKYLGTIIDSKLSFTDNIDYIFKKGQQRLYFLRQLNKFHIDRKIMTIFYQTFIQSILVFNFVCWYGRLSVRNKNKLMKIATTASKISGNSFESLTSIFERQTLKKVCKIIKDPTHCLYSQFQFLPSGRRINLPLLRSNRARQSFIPTGIRYYNGTVDIKS